MNCKNRSEVSLSTHKSPAAQCMAGMSERLETKSSLTLVLACVFASFQLITSIDNLYTQESTVFNPVRAKRPGAGGGATAETKK